MLNIKNVLPLKRYAPKCHLRSKSSLPDCWRVEWRTLSAREASSWDWSSGSARGSTAYSSSLWLSITPGPSRFTCVVVKWHLPESGMDHSLAVSSYPTHPLPIPFPQVSYHFENHLFHLPVTIALHTALAYLNGLYDAYGGCILFLYCTLTNIDNSIRSLPKSAHATSWTAPQ